MFESNIVGTFNLLETTKHLPYKGFINIGTASESDMLKARTFYVCMKASTSYLSRAFAFEYNKPIVTVRPSFVYGPGAKRTRFIDSLILALLRDGEFAYSPQSVNDWIYVTDVIEGMIAVAKHAGLLCGEFVNISSNSQYSSNDIVKQLLMVSGKNGKNIRPVRPLGATEKSNNGAVDNSILISLGWKKRVDIHEGLTLMYENYKRTVKPRQSINGS